MTFRSALAAISVWMVSVAAQEPPFLIDSAYHADGVLRFSPGLEIDWDLRMPDSLRALDIPNEDPRVIARFAPQIDMFGGVEIRSRTPVPEELVSRHVYMAGADGLRPLEVDSTLVTTRLEFNPSRTKLEGRRAWGESYVSTNAATETGGGFALHAARPLSFHVRPADLTADDLLLGSDAVQGTADGGYWGRGTAFWEIVAQYRFSVDGSGSEWIFVQWAPDGEVMEAGCRDRYALFLASKSDAPRQVAWTAYGCDV